LCCAPVIPHTLPQHRLSSARVAAGKFGGSRPESRLFALRAILYLSSRSARCDHLAALADC
jgi:hypothetical protein